MFTAIAQALRFTFSGCGILLICFVFSIRFVLIFKIHKYIISYRNLFKLIIFAFLFTLGVMLIVIGRTYFDHDVYGIGFLVLVTIFSPDGGEFFLIPKR